DGQVERCIRKGYRLRVGLDQLEAELEFAIQLLGGSQLCGRHIDSDDSASARSFQPGREIRRTASELDDVEAAYVREHPELAFGNIPRAPANLILLPRLARMLGRVALIRPRPQLTVADGVVRKLKLAVISLLHRVVLPFLSLNPVELLQSSARRVRSDFLTDLRPESAFRPHLQRCHYENEPLRCGQSRRRHRERCSEPEPLPCRLRSLRHLLVHWSRAQPSVSWIDVARRG